MPFDEVSKRQVHRSSCGFWTIQNNLESTREKWLKRRKNETGYTSRIIAGGGGEERGWWEDLLGDHMVFSGILGGSSLTLNKGGWVGPRQWTANKGRIFRILQSVRGGSGRFYCNITKIVARHFPPTPPPLPTINNDQFLTQMSLYLSYLRRVF